MSSGSGAVDARKTVLCSGAFVLISKAFGAHIWSAGGAIEGQQRQNSGPLMASTVCHEIS
jgi:hypothetical protein